MFENPSSTKLWLFTDQQLLIEPPSQPYCQVFGEIISKSQYLKLLSISEKVNEGQELDLESGLVMIMTRIGQGKVLSGPDIWMKSSSLLEEWCDQRRIVAKQVGPENKSPIDFKCQSFKVLNTGAYFAHQMNRRSDQPLSMAGSTYQRSCNTVHFTNTSPQERELIPPS